MGMISGCLPPFGITGRCEVVKCSVCCMTIDPGHAAFATSAQLVHFEGAVDLVFTAYLPSEEPYCVSPCHRSDA